MASVGDLTAALVAEVRCTSCNHPMRPSKAVQGLFWCVPCGTVLRTDRAEAEEPPRPLSRTHVIRVTEAAVLRRRVREALDEAKGLSAPWHVINPLVSAGGVLACALAIESESARRTGVAHAQRALEVWKRWREASAAK